MAAGAPIWKNPWVIGAAALALIVLVVGSSKQSASNAAQSQAVAAGADVQLAQYATNANTAALLSRNQQTTDIIGSALSAISNMANARAGVQMNADQVTGGVTATLLTNRTMELVGPTMAAISQFAPLTSATADLVRAQYSPITAKYAMRAAQAQASAQQNSAMFGALPGIIGAGGSALTGGNGGGGGILGAVKSIFG